MYVHACVSAFVCLFIWLVGGGIEWVGFFFFFCACVFMHVCIVLFLVCLFVVVVVFVGLLGISSHKLEPTGFLPHPLAHWDRESEQVLNMVMCVHIHMQVSDKMSVCVDTLNTTTTTCEPLTVFIMNNLAFCQLALKSEPAENLF